MDGNIHLKLAIRCLSSIGYWPRKFKNKFYQFLYSTYFKLTITVYVILVILEFVELYSIMGDNLEDLSILIGLNLFHILGLGKSWVASREAAQKLKRKINITEIKILTGEDDKIKRIYWVYVKQNHACNRFMIWVAFFCYLLYISVPYITVLLNPLDSPYDVIDNYTIVYRPKPLPLSSWYPFDRYKYYWIAYAWHVLAITLIPPYIIGCNNFFYSLIIFIIGQIKILQQHLIELRQNINDTPRISNDDRTVAERLRKCVVYHKEIILFVQELSDAMKTFLLMDFAGCGLQIAVIGFQTAVMPFSLQLIKTLSYLAAMLTQLFFFYWYANETILESMNVAKAIWDSEWYDCSKNIKRSLLIMKVRAQKPLTLSIGPFYHMSTESMMSIVRAGYSYAMLMRRFYSK